MGGYSEHSEVYGTVFEVEMSAMSKPIGSWPIRLDCSWQKSRIMTCSKEMCSYMTKTNDAEDGFGGVGIFRK